MTNPENGVRHDAERKQEIQAEVTLTDAQRDALLIAIQNELLACEKEAALLRESGLTASQDIEDYSAISQLITHLEEVQTKLTSRT